MRRPHFPIQNIHEIFYHSAYIRIHNICKIKEYYVTL